MVCRSAVVSHVSKDYFLPALVGYRVGERTHNRVGSQGDHQVGMMHRHQKCRWQALGNQERWRNQTRSRSQAGKVQGEERTMRSHQYQPAYVFGASYGVGRSVSGILDSVGKVGRSRRVRNDSAGLHIEGASTDLEAHFFTAPLWRGGTEGDEQAGNEERVEYHGSGWIGWIKGEHIVGIEARVLYAESERLLVGRERLNLDAVQK
nr:hypothetical protein CFP56_76218 [Quercus suber]